MSASKFYSACLSGVLSTKDIEIDKKGKSQQKVAVLPYLSKLLYNNCMIGDFINSGIAIRADYFVGDTRAVLSVGFRNNRSADIPVSLYNESIKILTHPTCKVLAIFRKPYNADKYDTCTYLAKGYEIDKFPEEIVQQLIISTYSAYNTSARSAIEKSESPQSEQSGEAMASRL